MARATGAVSVWREIISIAAEGTNLRATCHISAPEEADRGTRSRTQFPIGILFLNSGFHPRSAASDSSVHWADWLAQRGYPSIRLDLPGLGDSDGDLPSDVNAFLGLVNTGSYAAVIAAAAKSVSERLGLARLVVVGHCAGAVSALFGAAAANEIRGVVLLSPYFHLEEEEASTLRSEFRALIPRVRIARYLSKTYDCLKWVRNKFQNNRLPPNANLGQLRCWNELTSSGVPTLVIRPLPRNGRKGDFDYVRYMQNKHPKERIQLRQIPRTNHALVTGSGKEDVANQVAQWLDGWFPLTGEIKGAIGREPSGPAKRSAGAGERVAAYK